MYRIGICGYFDYRFSKPNGQLVKTRILKDELASKIGENAIAIVDTEGWKRNPFALLIKAIKLAFVSEKIIMLPAQNGLNVFLRIFVLMGMLLKKEIHYVVIGGWLPDYLEGKRCLLKYLKRIEGIHVETNTMKKALEEIGLGNIHYMPNFKRFDFLPEESLEYSISMPLGLCTFSRVMREKGIEDIIGAVKRVNAKADKTLYSLDIYGPIEEGYKERFNELIKDFPPYIIYRGIINYGSVTDILKHYFMLVFPTYYEGEGFPGTIIDGFSSGLPVLASDWRYNTEIVSAGVEGMIFRAKDEEDLVEKLITISKDVESILKMKVNCLNKSKAFHADVVIDDFLKKLKV